jgi:hypothetical protein
VIRANIVFKDGLEPQRLEGESGGAPGPFALASGQEKLQSVDDPK